MLTPTSLTPIRVIVVDDEAPARARLRRFLQAEPDFNLVGECQHGLQAVEIIRQERPDAVFLDVQMPRLNGFGVCETIGPAEMPIVVFVTAYDQYALKAFEVCAIDYLLKPFDQERFRLTLDRLRQRAVKPPPASVTSELELLLKELRSSSSAACPERLALRTEGKVVFLRLEEIDRVEAEGNYVRFHAGTTTHLVRETMNWCEQQLPAKRFLRISRSVIVNVDRVREVQPLFYGDHAVLLRDGTRLTLSRTHRDRLSALLPPARERPDAAPQSHPTCEEPRAKSL